ncbi:hypothetical protein GCM10010129_58140 [Streptomyces fumigatiscleroticus]|nr:hypothetical protein GCM10010129_58140 [Streptomyces fumigatiscleroticus]
MGQPRRQWAYDGKPLYTCIKDKKAGDQIGDGLKDVRPIAKPWPRRSRRARHIAIRCDVPPTGA